MNEVKRFDWLDLAKGIGIILVVMGHTLFPIHELLHVFHMPLFFILAGLTLKSEQIRNFLIKKIDKIFIPYVFFTLVSYVISFLVLHKATFNSPLWFLHTLFITLLILQILLSLTNVNGAIRGR